jgi:hypothetical protein
MPDQLTVGEWKTFLQARIKQEQGKDSDALPIFESLLAAHPHNVHLLASRAYALSRLKRGEDATASIIDAEYSQAGQTLVGSKDRPDLWGEKLTTLLGQIDQVEKTKTAGIAIGAVPW